MSSKKTRRVVVDAPVIEEVRTPRIPEVLLRDASTGEFYRGKRPSVTGSPSGNKGGEPYWEVRR
jgi:hypothetical protein